MSDFAITVFCLKNEKGFLVPPINVRYVEKDTGWDWTFTCGGTRAYLVRAGDPLSADSSQEAPDSHFMVRRITSALLLGGVGLFHPRAAGRILFRNMEGTVSWTSELDHPSTDKEESENSAISVMDWFGAICKHPALRRAADDAHLALALPHDALVFVYRGLEWLHEGLGTSWEELAKDMGVPFSEVRELKKTANTEFGFRHATKTGGKMRADVLNYATWVCGLIDAMNVARTRLEPGFTKMSPKAVSDAVLRAAPLVPYP